MEKKSENLTMMTDMTDVETNKLLPQKKINLGISIANPRQD